MMPTAGVQLDGQVLYERQKALRAHPRFPPAPQIVAVQLHAPDTIGSVLRLADAAGSSRVVFISTTDRDHTRVGKTARSCDSLVAWDVYRLEQFLDEQALFHPLIALELTSTSYPIFATKLPAPCTLVIGNERHGVPNALLSACQHAIHIPMYGTNGSMNVTHALGVALFEWRRQQAHYSSASC
ncbi:MAG: TrmH family RNA methyltransferase [Oscillochloris sp.]|nr:TrmH family RNA methyltransferase [Oscillochloris sp.]